MLVNCRIYENEETYKHICFFIGKQTHSINILFFNFPIKKAKPENITQNEGQQLRGFYFKILKITNKIE